MSQSLAVNGCVAACRHFLAVSFRVKCRHSSIRRIAQTFGNRTLSEDLVQPVKLDISTNPLRLGALLLVFVSGGCGQTKTSSGPAKSPAVAVSNQLAAVTAAGDPATLDQLSRMYEEPPVGQNAALIYAQAFAALSADGANAPDFLAHNREAVALLLQAADRPLCRYPVALTNGITALLPHLSSIRTCATLLRQEAVSQAASGDTDAATTAILAGFRLGRSLDNEPVLVSKLVEIASLEQALEGLHESLNQKSFTDGELLRLQTALSDAELAVNFRRAILGERAILVAVFQSSDEKLAEGMAATGESNAAATPSMLSIYRLGGHLEEDFAFALDFMSKLVELVDLRYPQALDAAAEMKILDTQSVLNQKLVVSAVLLPKPVRFVTTSAEAVARIRLARTVLAVEHYRLKHDGALPISLADLTAELPGGIPEDPFDGQPLRYKALPGRGYTIYSVGTNRKDDGGIVQGPDVKTPLDVVMTISRQKIADAINTND